MLRPRQPLADGSYLAKIYPCELERNQDRHGLLLRVIRYTLNDPQRVGHGQEHVLLTTLLDAYVPYVEGCEIHDNPYGPICRRCRDLIAQIGEETPIASIRMEHAAAMLRPLSARGMSNRRLLLSAPPTSQTIALRLLWRSANERRGHIS